MAPCIGCWSELYCLKQQGVASGRDYGADTLLRSFKSHSSCKSEIERKTGQPREAVKEVALN